MTADEALMDLNKAIELDPDNKPVKAGDALLHDLTTDLILPPMYQPCTSITSK